MNGNVENINEQSKLNPVEEKEIKIKTPAELKAILDEYVIGQDRAKKVLSVAVSNCWPVVG